MTRLRRRDKLTLALVLPLFAVCYGATLTQHLTGRLGFVHLTVHGAQSPDEYPRVRTFLNDRVAHESGLLPGDVLLEAGGRSLRGAGPWSFYAITAASIPRPVPIRFERAGVRMQTLLDVSPLNPQREIKGLVLGFCLVLVAVLTLVRAPQDHRSYLVFLVFTFLALNQINYPGGHPAFTYAWFVTFFLGELVYAPLAVVLCIRWLRRPIHRWEWLLPALFLLKAPLRHASLTGIGLPPTQALRAFVTLDVLMLLAILGYVLHNFYAGDALERRRNKWVAYGLFLGLIPTLLMNGLTIFDPSWWQARMYAQHGVVLVPLGFFIAIVRYDLFDIDRLISGTAAFTILGTVVLAAVLIGVPRVSHAMGPMLGVSTEAAQAVVSLALAVVAVPVGRRLRPRLDRLFFRDSHALQQGIEELLHDLSACPNAQALTQLTGERLDAMLRPELCAIYARAGEGFQLVFARGRAVPMVCPGGGPLATALTGRRRPLDLGRLARRGRVEPWSPAERSFVEALAASLLVPVTRLDQLSAFLCLGSKRSGDIYTETDLALLTSVADKVTTELRLFEDTDLIAQSRLMHEEMRRYVPAAVRRGLESSEDLEARERLVSVLFVDIRGYTNFSERHRPDEIFSMISRYTSVVSSIVQKLGGSIVEFAGDGLMAVFGAPSPLPEKEKAAVSAGREVLAAIRSIRGTDGGEPISVGVGIATGAAFVGSVEAADRMIWAVLGNTTNLAARLQSLTRELAAAIAIDGATWRAAGEAAAGFERREGISIRGRASFEDVYVLPRYSTPL